jgi:hypothetical protein
MHVTFTILYIYSFFGAIFLQKHLSQMLNDEIVINKIW